MFVGNSGTFPLWASHKGSSANTCTVAVRSMEWQRDELEEVQLRLLGLWKEKQLATRSLLAV